MNTVTELVNMIECQRAYEMNSKAITTTDQMLRIPHDQPLMMSRAMTHAAIDRETAGSGRAPGPLRALLGSALSAAPAVTLCAALAGCGMMPRRTSIRKPLPARVLPPPTPRTDGAIYQAGQEMALFADLKARRVGDVLTIVLNESTNASKSAITKTTKTSATADTGPDHLRQIHHHQGRSRFSTRP